MANSKRKVVVTGLGVISSLGSTAEEFWASLVAGRSGIKRVSLFDVSDYPCQIGGEITDFDATRYMEAKDVRRNDRYVHFAVGASRLAVQDAGLDTTKLNHEQFGVIIGSGIGGLMSLEAQARILFERGPRKVSPFMIPQLIGNMASGIVAIEHGALGPNFCVVSACATATHAMGEALRAIQYGDADIMLAGGSEAPITALGFAGFCAMKAMSTSNDAPEKASRPFDAKRDGFVMGEGAGILVLESEEHAKARGARIYCEFAGYSATCDAFHITQPDPEGKGLSAAMRRAVTDAGVPFDSVDYINAHGTSTAYNDKFETLAIKRVFGDHARKVAISSTKSMTGHLLGAAGAVEAAACIMAIRTGRLPPTINLENPDPDCDLDYVPNVARDAKVTVALSNNLGFGGQNAAAVFRACDE
ncbi:MAG TPA: beta-ketoacyl-ACP synthase II [Opitutaceae bacterium]|nr:beta-ketoacyl-ACP synthase II [Opitutaceae bacterium]